MRRQIPSQRPYTAVLNYPVYTETFKLCRQIRSARGDSDHAYCDLVYAITNFVRMKYRIQLCGLSCVLVVEGINKVLIHTRLYPT